MSLKFTQLKSPTLGLDSVLDFGRHFGYTVSEMLKDRPEYIQWLVTEGKKFYPSVHSELLKSARKYKPYIYYGDLRGEMAHEIMLQIQEAIDDGYDWEDVPF